MKTRKDLLIASLSELGIPMPELAVQELLQSQQIKLFGGKELMSDEEFEQQLALFRKELPSFLHFLMTQDASKFPRRTPTQN
jgi:hypothetical protein